MQQLLQLHPQIAPSLPHYERSQTKQHFSLIIRLKSLIGDRHGEFLSLSHKFKFSDSLQQEASPRLPLGAEMCQCVSCCVSLPAASQGAAAPSRAERGGGCSRRGEGRLSRMQILAAAWCSCRTGRRLIMIWFLEQLQADSAALKSDLHYVQASASSQQAFHRWHRAGG